MTESQSDKLHQFLRPEKNIHKHAHKTNTNQKVKMDLEPLVRHRIALKGFLFSSYFPIAQ